MNIAEFWKYFEKRWGGMWCRCICTIYPDGTMCKLCGHAHYPSGGTTRGGE